MGKVDIQTSGNTTTIALEGDTGKVTVGGGGQQGTLIIKNSAGTEMIRIGCKWVPLANGGFFENEIVMFDGAGEELIRLGGTGQSLTLRDNANKERVAIQGHNGDFIIRNASGVEVIRLNGSTGDVGVGGGGQNGDIKLRDSANLDKIRLASNPAKLEILDGANFARISLDGDLADVSIGGATKGGDLILRNAAGSDRLHLEGDPGVVTFRKPNGSPTIRLDGGVADVAIGGVGEDGDIVIKGGPDDVRIRLDAGGGPQAAERLYLDGASGTITCGGSVVGGTVVLKNETGQERISLRAVGNVGHVAILPAGSTAASVFLSADGSIQAGAAGKEGVLLLRDANSREIVRVTASSADILAGCKGRGANVHLVPASSTADAPSAATSSIHLNADDGSIRAGGAGKEGFLLLRDANSREVVRINSSSADIFAGCKGRGANFHLVPASSTADAPSAATSSIHLNADDGTIRVGAGGKDGLVLVRNKDGVERVRIDGAAGDVILANADCAEEFDTVADTVAAPGSVLVIGDDERLTLATEAYDRRVAGVVSGAGSYRPGIVLGRSQESRNRPAVALVGKVFCFVDAEHGDIRVGDLLVSSTTPGHAMAAKDAARTPGAVLGKALRAWSGGRGMIPILVSLQ